MSRTELIEKIIDKYGCVTDSYSGIGSIQIDDIDGVIDLICSEAISAVMSLPARGDMRRLAIQAITAKLKGK